MSYIVPFLFSAEQDLLRQEISEKLFGGNSPVGLSVVTIPQGGGVNGSV